MAVEAQLIHDKILEAIPDAKIEIIDLRGDGDHYSAHVVSSAFEGQNRVQQHKMVQKALGDILGGQLHALAIQTSTPKSE